MIEEKFIRKNEIGVDIEYETISLYPKDGKEYLIYTDYVPSNDIYKIRLYADVKVAENKYERLNEKEEKRILEEFYNDTTKEISKLDDKEKENETPPNDKLEELQRKLEKEKKQNNEKEMIHIRGQLIKELNYRIKIEKDLEKKQELEDLKQKTLADHKELINKKYKDDYVKKKKTFAGIVTVLPKGIALAFKKVAATIEELKLARTTKEKTKGIEEALKDSLQLIGTPIDFSLRFAVNHWYLLLLLLSFKLPIIDKIPFSIRLKNKNNNNFQNMETQASLASILETIKEYLKEKSLEAEHVIEATKEGIGSVFKNPSSSPASNVSPEVWTPADQKKERLAIKSIEEATKQLKKVQGTPVITTTGMEAFESAVEAQETKELAAARKVLSETVADATQTMEMTEEVTSTIKKVSDEFIQMLKDGHNFVIGEDIPDMKIVHSAEEFVNYIKEINSKAPVTLEGAADFYNDYSRMTPLNIRNVIWPEVDEELHYFSTKEELIQYILEGKSKDLTEYFESFENSDSMNKLFSDVNFHKLAEELAEKLGVSVTVAIGILCITYAGGKALEFSAVGPLALHP